MTSIKQNTPEWLAAKVSKIGASEIYSLIYHYCRPELEKLGVDLIKEKPFKSALELFLKIKHGIENNDIKEVYSEFGHGMEPYICQRLKKELSECRVNTTDDFVLNEILHNLAACSPDGYIKLLKDKELIDYDKTCKID